MPRFAIVLAEATDVPLAEKYFERIIKASRRLPPNTELLVVHGLSGLQTCVSEVKQLAGIAMDKRLSTTTDNEHVKMSLKVFEIIQIPVYFLNTTHLHGGAMEQKILESQWNMFEQDLGKYSPRGLRAHDRQVLHLKVVLKPINSPNSLTLRSVTFDLSLGGCFVVLFDDLDTSDEIFVGFDDQDEFIKCRMAWKRAWGSTRHSLPGLGLQFVDLSVSNKKMIQKCLETKGA